MQTVELEALFEAAVEGVPRLQVFPPEQPVELALRDPARVIHLLRGLLVGLAETCERRIVVRASQYVDGRVARLWLFHPPTAQEFFAARREEELGEGAGELPDERWARPYRELEAELGQPPVPGLSARWPRLFLELPWAASATGPRRTSFPDLSGCETWEQRYQVLLAESSWEGLRRTVFRFGRDAEAFGRWCRRLGFRTTLCPSVGLAIDPWLLAYAGVQVVAFDEAPTPLSALAHPERLPRVYSRQAHERWHAEQVHLYGGCNYKAIDEMPDLDHATTREILRSRIAWTRADWERLPLAAGAVDTILACNALPRDRDVGGVLEEWVRVLRPGGLLLVRMHNAYGIVDEVERRLRERGWKEAPVFELGDTGWRPLQPTPLQAGARGHFQVLGSSG